MFSRIPVGNRAAAPLHLVVGLGNPGREYEGTRHNVGFEVVRILARRAGVPLAPSRFRADTANVSIGASRVLLACPTTFMNNSGEAVAAICHFYKVETENIIVVLDDVALPVGRLRLRYKGSAGGHNGLSHILKVMQTDSIPRVRLGVGAAEHGDLIDHVLSRFRRAELGAVEDSYELASAAVECALAEGFESAMNKFNVPVRPA